jgi:peptide deformylase
MKSLGIQIYGKAVLRRKSEPLEEFGSDLPDFLEQMVETMIVEEGVGLAAPQVGVSKRITVINPEPDNEKTLIRMINPRIVSFGSEEVSIEEGCLSVPGIRGNVIRPSTVEVIYQDEQGVERSLKAEGLLARIIQHEIDHLDGILFMDRFSLAKKMLIKSKLRSLTDESGREE